jgi:VCBS repeat-containing protein
VAAVTITVTPVNDTPLAAADSFVATQNTELSIAAPGLLANDSDVDGNETIGVVLTPIIAPEHGTLTLSADGSFLYTPDSDYVGPDSFTYEITDGELTSQATVTLTVEVEGEGESAAMSSGDEALLAYLASEDDMYSLDGDDNWTGAVDEILAQLA